MKNKRKEQLQTLIEKMGIVSRAIHANQCIRFGGMTLGQLQIRTLFYIAKCGDNAGVRELVKMLGVTPGAVTQLVDGLVEMKLVNRQEDPHDRRMVRLKLTQFAEGELESLKQSYLASASRIFGTLNDAEIAQFVTLLNKVNASPATAPPKG